MRYLSICSGIEAASVNLRDCKGRHHTEQAARKLFGLLPPKP